MHRLLLYVYILIDIIKPMVFATASPANTWIDSFTDDDGENDTSNNNALQAATVSPTHPRIGKKYGSMAIGACALRSLAGFLTAPRQLTSG